MVFNSSIFLLVFLPAVLTLFWVARSKQQRYLLLTISGYIFYGYWNWRFCFLLLLSSLVSFGAGLAIDRSAGAPRRRGWMIASITLDLVVLGVFKYYNFFASTARSLLPHVALPVSHLVLPIGISFYTFHTISYIVDVAARRVRASYNLFEYLAYVSLFSQLVAGPIVRFRQIEADLEQIDRGPREDEIARGIGLFVIGLIKKVIVADQIAALVDPLIGSYATFSTVGAWLAALGFTFQIYYDFSGYSDMAVGLGHLFGLRIPRNFDAPYRADSLQDFWRRWHISLSTWLRDYLYIPLGGSRRGAARTALNVMATMLLGGLWHGASWTFVLWGGYHGALLVLGRALEPRLAGLPLLVRRGGTFGLVVISWVLFRSTSMSMAVTWLARMFGRGAATDALEGRLAAWVLLCFAAVNLLPEPWSLRFSPRRRFAVLSALAFFVAYLFMNDSSSSFLYYQF